MSEPRVSELTKALGVLTERLDGLGHTLDARFQAADRRIDDLRREVHSALTTYASTSTAAWTTRRSSAPGYSAC